MLAQRLRELEAAGVVQRRKLDPPAGSWVYELTDWGRELEDIVIALGRWGSRSPLADEELLKSSVDATVLALKADFDQAAAKGLDATYALQLDGEPFRVRVANGAIEIARGRPKDPDAVIESEQEALAAVLWGQDSVTEGVRSGRVKLEGDRTTAKRFFSLFPLPTRVEIEAG